MSSAVEESEKLLSRMTRAEKAQLLQWIMQDLGDTFPGIESNPCVAGEPRVLCGHVYRCGC